LLIPATKLRTLIDTDAALAAQCARTLSRHWRLLVVQIKDFKTQSAVQRLARFLVTQSGVHSGPCTVTLGTSKKDVAKILGIAPETLSRALKKLHPHGVETRGETVVIAAIERLEGVASAHGRAH
jgi:CRP/FNR family transcriptional activator FtrB